MGGQGLEIRDPIHGFIQPEGIEADLLDSMPMQRLRGIKQLALACLVYPGAHHTRFEHSLGAMHVAERMARRIGLTEERRRIVRFATLLHDVGHGPFSHVSEQLLERFGDPNSSAHANVDSLHERITLDVIQHHQPIRQALGRRLEAVVELIQKSETRSAERDIVSGAIDADKLDYLLRDTYFAGVKYGVVDLDRIINTLHVERVGRKESHLVIAEGGAWAVAQLLLAKYHMTAQVYHHRARAITDAMIVRMVGLAIEDGAPGVRNLFTYDGSVRALERYLGCDDDGLLQMIRQARRARRAQGLCKRLQVRQLFKEVFRKNISEFPSALVRDKLVRLSREEVLQLERSVARVINKRPSMVILDVQDFSNPTYRPPGFEVQEGDILVKLRNGNVVKIQEMPGVITGSQQKRQTHVNVYCEMDGMAAREREQYRRRIEPQVMRTLDRFAR